MTSVTLWDGDGDDVIHYDFTHAVETEFCLCCFNDSDTSDFSVMMMVVVVVLMVVMVVMVVTLLLFLDMNFVVVVMGIW